MKKAASGSWGSDTCSSSEREETSRQIYIYMYNVHVYLPRRFFDQRPTCIQCTCRSIFRSVVYQTLSPLKADAMDERVAEAKTTTNETGASKQTSKQTSTRTIATTMTWMDENSFIIML